MLAYWRKEEDGSGKARIKSMGEIDNKKTNGKAKYERTLFNIKVVFHLIILSK